MLLNITYKVPSSVLYNRLVKYVEQVLSDYQCGFRPNKSTSDQISVMRQIPEKAYEYGINLHSLYIEFKKAFASVNRDRMFQDIIILGIPKKYTSLINVTLKSSRAAVRVDGCNYSV